MNWHVAAVKGMAPAMERHAWAKQVAGAMVGRTHLSTYLAHRRHRALLALHTSGEVGRDTISSAEAYLATDLWAEAAWLIGYCIEAGAEDVARGKRLPGQLYRGPVPGWPALEPFDPRPDWWPWPATGHCERVLRLGGICGDPTPHGADDCGEHD